MKRIKRDLSSVSNGISIADSKSIDLYLREVSKLPLISAEEEVTLARQIKAGNRKAADKLITANLRFVISVAKKYQNQGLSLPDLISEGNTGLMKAAYRFDETRGFKFISYAVWWIKQSIRQALDEKAKTIRIPINKLADKNKVTQVREKLMQLYQREPSQGEMAVQTEFKESYINVLQQISTASSSIDSPLSSGEDSTYADVLSNTEEPQPDHNLVKESLKIDINRMLSVLTQREAEVVRMYFGLERENPHTLEEIGEFFDLTRERVRQIKEKALRKLRCTSKNEQLLSYV